MKTRMMMLLVMAILSTSLFAQRKGANATPEKIAERQTQMMKENLGLSAEQEKQIYELNLKAAQENQAARSEARESRQAKEADVKAVLTPEQQAKFDELRKEKRSDNKEKSKSNRKTKGSKKAKADA